MAKQVRSPYLLVLGDEGAVGGVDRAGVVQPSLVSFGDGTANKPDSIAVGHAGEGRGGLAARNGLGILFKKARSVGRIETLLAPDEQASE